MSKETGSLQIVHVRVENILGIREACFEPSAGASILYGDNGSGKTSLLSAVSAAFKGLPAELITKGEDHASVFLRLAGPSSSYTISRRRTASGQKLEIRDERDGTSVDKPSSFLSGLLGDFSLDPGRFAIAPADEQVRLFCDAFPVMLFAKGVSEVAERLRVKVEGRNGFLVLREIEAALEEERRACGVEKRKALAVAEEVAPRDTTLVRDPSKTAAAKKALEDARVARGTVDVANRAIADRNARRRSVALDLDAARTEPERVEKDFEANRRRIEAEIERLRVELGRFELRRDSLLASASAKVEELAAEQVKLGEVEETATTTELDAAVAAAAAAVEAANRHEVECDKIDQWKAKREDAAKLERQWAELDEFITKEVRGSWVRALWRQIPETIPGLELAKSEDGKPFLAIRETPEAPAIPLASCNTARRIQVGVRIAAALNHDYPVRVLAVDDAEHLTRKNRDELAAAAADAGFQVLMLVASDPEDVPVGELRIDRGIVRRVD